jgi:hypothetical protein
VWGRYAFDLVYSSFFSCLPRLEACTHTLCVYFKIPLSALGSFVINFVSFSTYKVHATWKFSHKIQLQSVLFIRDGHRLMAFETFWLI